MTVCSKGVSKKLQGVLRVFQGDSSQGPLMQVLMGCFKRVSMIFQGCFKGVSRVYQRCCKDVSRKYTNCFNAFYVTWHSSQLPEQNILSKKNGCQKNFGFSKLGVQSNITSKKSLGQRILLG